MTNGTSCDGSDGSFSGNASIVESNVVAADYLTSSIDTLKE